MCCCREYCDPHLWAPGVIRVQVQPVGGPWPYPHPELLCRHVWHVHTHYQISTGQLLLGTGYLHRHEAYVRDGWVATVRLAYKQAARCQCCCCSALFGLNYLVQVLRCDGRVALQRGKVCTHHNESVTSVQVFDLLMIQAEGRCVICGQSAS